MRSQLDKEMSWLFCDIVIRGYEGDGGTGDTGGTGDGGDGGDGGTGDGGTGGTGDEGQTGDQGGTGDKASDDYKELKAALEAERKISKQREKDLKALQRADDARKTAELSDTEKAKKEAADAATKVQALAVKLKENAVQSAIVAAATTLKFHDVQDAIRQVDQSGFVVEQDEDNPADIDIDAKSIETAVKALAKSKPYLINEGDDESGGPSGSKFNGRRKDKQALDDDAMIAKYPALRGV